MLNSGEALRWLIDLCIAGAAVGGVYLAATAWLILRYRTGEPRRVPVPVPVSVIVPLCGQEPGLYERLLALCDQQYSGKIEIVCGTLDRHDAAIEIIAAVKKARPAADLHCHADPKLHGQSRKVSNLSNIFRHVRYDTLVMMDSDIEVEPDHVSRVVAELQRPGVGAVTCLYAGLDCGTAWSRLSAMTATLHFIPNVIGGLALGLARPCLGPTIAMSRDVLNRIGGIASFTDQLFDDYAIGEARRATRYTG